MAALEDKVKMALDEARILVLGVQVLVGLEFQSVFQRKFADLPQWSQDLKLLSLGLLLLSLGFIMSPAPFHQIVDGGYHCRRSLRHVTVVTGIALLPFALGLGGDVYVAVERVVGPRAGVAGAIAAILTALFFWYGLELLQRFRHGGKQEQEGQGSMESDQKKSARTKSGPEQEDATLKDKLTLVLTETRVVLPGAQALLGFQFATMLTEQFEALPRGLKYLHLGSLGAIAVSTVLLMAPASFHRLAERGENTERAHRFASRMVLVAMAFMALGITGDLYLVTQKVTGSSAVATGAASGMLVFFYGLWFGYSLLRRGDRREEEPSAEGQAARSPAPGSSPERERAGRIAQVRPD